MKASIESQDKRTPSDIMAPTEELKDGQDDFVERQLKKPFSSSEKIFFDNFQKELVNRDARNLDPSLPAKQDIPISQGEGKDATPDSFLPHIEASSGYNQDEIIESYRLSRKLDLPEPAVRENLLEVRRIDQARTIEQNSHIAEWVKQNPIYGPVAMADVLSLETLGEFLVNFKNLGKVPAISGQILTGVVTPLFEGLDAMEEAIANILKVSNITEGQRTGVFGKASDFFLENYRDLERYNEEHFPVPEKFQGRLIDNLQYLKRPEYWSHASSDALASLAAIIGMAFVTRNPRAITGGFNTGLAAYYGGSLEGMGLYSQLRADGVNRRDAFSAGIGHGITSAALEKLSFDKIFKGGLTRGKIELLLDLGVAGITEGITEYLEEPSEAFFEGLAKGKNSKEIAEDVKKSFENIDVIPGSLVAGVLGRGVGRATQRNAQVKKDLADMQAIEEAVDFANKFEEVYKRAKETKIGEESPELLKSFMSSMDADNKVYFQAKSIMELESRNDIIKAFNLDPGEVEALATLGQDIEMDLSDVLSANLDGTQLESISNAVRKDRWAYSAEEVNHVKDFLNTIYDKNEARNDYVQKDLKRIEGLAKLESQSIQAINNIPGLKAQAEALAGSVENYVKDVSQMWGMVSNRLGVDIFDKVQVVQEGKEPVVKVGENEDVDGSLGDFPPQTSEEYRNAILKEIMDTPLLDREPRLRHIWGRLDGKSLRNTWPDAYREIVKNHGIGIFRKDGSPADILADEMVRDGIVQDGFTADDLVELLKRPREDFTLYQRSPGSKQLDSVHRGALRVASDGYTILLSDQANLSTIFHESAHIFLEEMQRIEKAGLANESLSSDISILKDWLEVSEGETLSVDQHEKFAKGFETYLMEGKAPSEKLLDVFRRFRDWLLNIYNDSKALGVELTDEVRGVFDRLMATEEEITNVSALYGLMEITNEQLDALGVTGPTRNYMSRLAKSAQDKAIEEWTINKEKERSKRRREFRKESEKDLEGIKAYRVRSELHGKSFEDGTGPWLDVDMVNDLYGADVAQRVRQSVGPGSIRKNGANPEEVAVRHGYDSGRQMIEDIASSLSKKDMLNSLVSIKEFEHDSTFNSPSTLLATDEALRQSELLGEYYAKNLGKVSIEQKAIKEVAKDRFKSELMKKARSHAGYALDASRAMQRERRSFAMGDIEGALEANYATRINMEFVRLAREMDSRQGVVERRVKRFVNMAKGDPVARFAVMSMASGHGLMNVNLRLAEGKDLNSIKEWIDEMSDAGYQIYLDENILGKSNTPWRDLTVSEFEALSNNINQIVTVEQNFRKISTIKGRKDLNNLASEMEASIYEANKVKNQRLIASNNQIFTVFDKGMKSLVKPEILCMILDGKENGPVVNNVYNKLSALDEARSARMRYEVESLKNLYSYYTNKEFRGLIEEKIYIKSLDETITKENAIVLAMNLGNEVNVQRLKEARLSKFSTKKIDDRVIAEVVSNLSNKDFDFIESTWDYLESFREESFALEERMNGFRPEKVEASPFTVRTKEGDLRTLKGGYFPIVYDSSKSSRAGEIEAKKEVLNIFGGNVGGSVTTPQGHLKQRANRGLGTPLRLSFTTIDNHVYNVVGDITMREGVVDVVKIIRNDKFRSAVESTLGVNAYNLLMPWVNDIVRAKESNEVHFIVKASQWMRGNTANMAMGFKSGTMLLQLSGAFPAISRVGVNVVASGLRSIYGKSMHLNPVESARRLKSAYEFITSKSEFMSTRVRLPSFEVKEAHMDKIKGQKPRHVLREKALVGIGYTQLLVDMPVWMGVYEKTLKETMGDEQTAINKADRAVRVSQGSGRTIDLPAIQRGGELGKMLTMFQSWFNTMYNMAYLDWHRTKQSKSTREKVYIAGNYLFWASFVTPTAEILIDALRGRLPDDDDEDGWKMYLIGKYGGYWANMFPIARNIFSAFTSPYGVNLFPTERGAEELVIFGKDTYKLITGENKKTSYRITAELLRTYGYATGVPTEPVAQILLEVDRVVEGKKPEIELRKLITR